MKTFLIVSLILFAPTVFAASEEAAPAPAAAEAPALPADPVADFTICLDTKDFACARRILAEQKAVIPEDPLIGVLEGELAKAEGKPKEALAAYGRALEKDPRYRDAYIQRAILLYDMRLFDEGLKDFRAVYDMDPESLNANMNLGSALLRARKNTEAIPYFQKALEKDPGLANAHVSILMALKEEGRENGPEGDPHRVWLQTNRPDLFREYFATEPFNPPQANAPAPTTAGLPVPQASENASGPVPAETPAG